MAQEISCPSHLQCRLGNRSDSPDRAHSDGSVSRSILWGSSITVDVADDRNRYGPSLRRPFPGIWIVGCVPHWVQHGQRRRHHAILAQSVLRTQVPLDLYAFTWTMYAFGAAASPILIGKLFDSLGSHRPVTIQLLALPPFVSCLLIFLQPRDVEPYRILRLARRSSNREHLIRVLGPISEKSLARSSFHLAV